MKSIIFTILYTAFSLVACNMAEKPIIEMEDEIESSPMAEVVNITASGTENNYTFSVGIKSPDTGCDQYANWWEVISEDGSLIYRRILGHSHVDEQPFIRSGGTVKILNDQIVIIRAHMNNLGYGNNAYKGSVNDGFKNTTLELDFALDVELLDPQPGDCAF